MLKGGYRIEDFKNIISGSFLQRADQATINHIITDSRKFEFRDGSVFFALSGMRRDGHSYLQEMYRKGVRIFVVSTQLGIPILKNATIIAVENTVEALQQFAAHHRSLFQIPVIGITGSNGKTIVKEWIYQLLYTDFHVIRSPKSYNSQIGVSLSVLLIDESNDLAVFEAGISRKGEMEKLEKMIKPEIGIFTNIGPAHQENFANHDEKIDEKLKLFTDSKTLIYCRDHEEIHERITSQLQKPALLTWSRNHDADLKILNTEKAGKKTKITGRYNGIERTIEIPFNSPTSIENACHVWLLLLNMEISDAKIADHFTTLTPVAMRLEQLDGINGCVLINDVYNSDVNSLTIALDYLKFLSKNQKYTAIVSDILQSGEDEEKLYARVASLLKSRGITRFIGIGEQLTKHAGLFSDLNADFYLSTGAFIQNENKREFVKENILIKGSRSFEFERITDFLQEKSHETVLEIDLTKMVENLNFIRTRLRPETKIMAMVKAFAYGAGSYDIAQILEYNRVEYLAVAYADEGISLREDGITLPIMVLNPELSSYDAMIRYQLEPQLFSFRTLEYFTRALKESTESRRYPVHIKINTGMNRLGFDLKDLPKLAEKLLDLDVLEVKTVFSHLAGSDDPKFEDFTNKQIADFQQGADILSAKLPNPFMRHILNSSGILRFPEAQFDMVRLGLAMYGITTSAEFKENLKPVSTLKTVISQIREIPAGAGVGYSPKKTVSKPTKIAVIPVGYADGLPRLLGNGGGNVLISNTPVPLIGNICMDMSMVDVTGVDCEEGDNVEVFGEHLDIYEMAEHLHTIPYEVLTNISQRVKRVFTQD